MQFGHEKHPTLPDVPRLIDLAKTDDERKIAEIEGLVELVGHTNVAPPDVPAARTAALRNSIAATYRDAAFKAAATRVKMTVDPISAEDVEKYVKQILATPPDLLAKARVAFGMN
jgi:tripartite-type tricarboxylate transporter receptor subunit TctC